MRPREIKTTVEIKYADGCMTSADVYDLPDAIGWLAMNKQVINRGGLIEVIYYNGTTEVVQARIYVEGVDRADQINQ